MPNQPVTFKTSELAEAFLGEWVSDCPFLAHTSNYIEKKFTAGNGTTINVALPSIPKGGEGAELDEANLGYDKGSVELTLKQHNVAVAPEAAIVAHDINDLSEQVLAPYANTLAHDVQSDLYAKALGSAGHVEIITGANPGEVSKNALRIASMKLDKFYAAGAQRYACVDPMILAGASDFVNIFLPGEISKGIWADCAIGKFAKAEYYSMADCRNITGVSLAGATVSDAAEGDDELELTWSTFPFSADDVIPAGLPFKVQSGTTPVYYKIDMYGHKSPEEYVFVVKEDHVVTAAEVTAGALTVKINKISTNDATTGNRALMNISALPNSVDGNDVVDVLTAGKTYATGLIYDKKAVITAQAKLAKLTGTDSRVAAESPTGAVIQCTVGQEIKQGRDIYRWDALTGCVVPRPSWTTGLYLQMD